MPSPPISILQPLSPRVFVLQSEDVREACAPNGCTGLEEIVRPWEGSVERGLCAEGQAALADGSQSLC